MFDQYNDLLSVEELCEMIVIGENSAYTHLANGEYHLIMSYIDELSVAIGLTKDYY